MDYKPPDCWNFPPFFTLQPNQDTRKKQYELWRQLIVNYHAVKNEYKMNPSSFLLFRNENIDRQVTDTFRQKIIEYLISSGNAEWEDSTKSILNIYHKSLDSIAEELYVWANNKGYINNVLTIYELYSGDEHTDTGLVNMDASIVRKAIEALENKGKCSIIAGSTPDEDGVKFLAV